MQARYGHVHVDDLSKLWNVNNVCMLAESEKDIPILCKMTYLILTVRKDISVDEVNLIFWVVDGKNKSTIFI